MQCYECGCEIGQGDGRRRRVRVGSSRSLFGADWRIYYASEMICRACTYKVDAWRVIVMIAVVFAACYFLVFSPDNVLGVKYFSILRMR